METADFLEMVRDTARLNGMDLSRPLALVSGGPDSVALFRALVELGSEPVALHVDHGLRGEESRRDADFVRELCEEFGAGCEVRRIEIRPDLGNLQEVARKERYRLAHEIVGRGGFSCIATGHTADDVAETVLLNLARGAGLRGLSGIPPTRGMIARPLIERQRTEILRYLELLGQPFRTDSTNLTGKYSRNRVRLEVVATLEELYPGAARNIARTASLLREDLHTLEGMVEDVPRQRGEEVVLPLDGLEKMPLSLRRYAVRRAYAMTGPGEANLGSAEVEGVLELASRVEGTRTVDLPGRVVCAARSGAELAFYRREERFSGELELSVGVHAFDRWTVRVSEVRAFDDRDAARPEVAYLDADQGPYRVRLAREGDTIRPLGLGGTKKVLRAMMDRKVPRDLRRKTPVMTGSPVTGSPESESEGRVAWVFMGELGEDFGVGEATKNILRVEVERVP